ncbi:MAG: hypothetical protein JNL21_16865 [Myxococcales bacterium]|nr:hypothetical protein [Myxococcales bacterium]
MIRASDLRHVALALGVLTLAPRLAHAQPSAVEKETARTWVAKGNERFEADDPEGALEAFRKADEIVHAPTTALGVGRALVKLGRLVEARDVFLRIARIPESPDESSAFRSARDEAARSADALASRIATLTLRVSCASEGAVRVTVDGQTVPMNGEAGMVRLDPGSHTIRGAASGCSDGVQQIEVGEGQQAGVELSLARVSAPRAPAKPRAAHPPRSESPVAIPLIAAGSVVAGLGLAVGIGTGAASLDAASGLRDVCSDGICPTKEEERGSRALTLAHVSTTSFVLAGAGAIGLVTGVVLWNTQEPRKESTMTRRAATLRFVVGPSYGALAGELE